MSEKTIVREIVAKRSFRDHRRLRERREAIGVTQEQMAGIVGVTQGAVSRWEHGVAEPVGRHAARYLETLDRLEASVLEGVCV